MLLLYYLCLKASPPSAACMRQWVKSTLVQVMACCWFGTKPLHEPMLTSCPLDPWKQTLAKFEIEMQNFSFMKIHLKMSSAKCWPFCSGIVDLTHWGRVTHICVSKLTTTVSDNGLSPGRRQAIIWTNARILSISPLGTTFSEISIGVQTFSFKKMELKMSSAKWRRFFSATIS